jgi:Protein of unknown function (DUF3465)
MRKLLSIVFVLGVAYVVLDDIGLVSSFQNRTTAADSVIAEAFASRRSDFLVEGQGEVVRILSDDVDGDRHQRFILRLDSGQTLLVAHNIDLAPRVPQIREGEFVEFFGEYEWNDQGGVIHWTHRDPQGKHQAGWLKYRGATYQ